MSHRLATETLSDDEMIRLGVSPRRSPGREVVWRRPNAYLDGRDYRHAGRCSSRYSLGSAADRLILNPRARVAELTAGGRAAAGCIEADKITGQRTVKGDRNKW